MEELVPEIHLLNKAKLENNVNEIARLLKELGQQLWQKVIKKNEITLNVADLCLNVYKIYQAANKISKENLITNQEILELKDFLFKEVLKSNNNSTNFLTYIDKLHKSLREIQCKQAKEIINQAQEKTKKSDKVNTIKEGFQELNLSLHKLLSDIVQLAIDFLGDDSIDKKNFSILLLGSWAKGTATPYSDIEFCILINETDPKLKEALRRMVYIMNFIVISLKQTALPFNLFQLENEINGIDLDDLMKPGFQFDLGGKTPLGRLDKDYDLIQTPQQMANYIDLNTLDQDPLLVAELIDCQYFFGNKKLYEDYKKMIDKQLNKKEIDHSSFHKNLAKILLFTGTKNLQADLEKYKINVDKVSHEGKLLNIKTEIYRLPDRLIEGLRLIFATPGNTLWEKISGLLKSNIISKEGATNLEFMTAVALQSRLFTYVTNDSQNEKFGIWDTKIAPNSLEVENFFCIDDISDLAIICFRFMLYREAELLLLEAQRSGPKDAYFQLFRLYSHLGKPQLANEYYEKYIENKPLDVDDLFNLGYLKLSLEDHKSALELFNCIPIKLEMNNQAISMECVQAYCNIANIEGLLGNKSSELAHLEKAKEIVDCISEKRNHIMIVYYISFAKWFVSQNQFSLGEQNIQNALDFANNFYNKRAHVKLIDIYQQAAEIAERFNQLEQALNYRKLVIQVINTLYVNRIISQLLESHLNLANTYFIMEKIDEAEKELALVASSLDAIEHNLAYDALSFKLSHGYMKVYQAKKSYESAYEYYKKTITLIDTTFERNSYYKQQIAEFYLDAFDTLVNYDQQEESKQKLHKVIDIITKQFGERNNNVAKAYSKLAIFDLVQEEYKSAERNLLKAYEIYEQLPKIYNDYLTTLKNLIKVCQHLKDGREIVFAEKFYQYVEKLQPKLFLDALKCFLDATEKGVLFHPILSQIDDILAKVANLNLSYPVEEIENFDYDTLKEILKIREVEHKCHKVQITTHSNRFRDIQFSKTLNPLVTNYNIKCVKLSKLLKRGDTNGPNLIAIINNYSELIDYGKHLLNEINTQLVPKDKLEIALLNVDKLESIFDQEQYLRDALLKYSINNVSEEEFKQLLDISGQFTITIDMAIAYIRISESKIKDFCTFLSSCNNTFRNAHPYIKNDACLNSFAIYCNNRGIILTFILTKIMNNEVLAREIFYFIYLLGDKASTTFFLFILIKHGLSEEHSNQILKALFNLKFLKNENEQIFITSFIRALLTHEFDDLRLSDIKIIKAFIEACSQYLKDRNIRDSESTLVINLYRHVLLKFHDLIDIFNQTTIGNIIFLNNHLYLLSSIYNDLNRSDQKSLLELLLNLHSRFNIDKNTELYSEALTLLAFSERNSSNYHRHLILIQKAHAINSRLYKHDDPLFAKSLFNLARAFGDIKNNEKQIELSKEGLNILEKDYNLNHDILDADIRINKEVDIVNAFINLAAGYSRVDDTLRIELLEQCLNFYNKHNLNRPDVKANIFSSLVNVYSCKIPLKALEIYEQLEILQKQLYQEGTQEYAFKVGYSSLNHGLAISQSSLALIKDLNVLDKTSEKKINNAREIIIKARHAINKAINLFTKFYQKDYYLYSQACDALSCSERIENELAMLLKSLEGYRLFNSGDFDKAISIYCEIFDSALNQEVKSEALANMATIDFIKIKENGVMSQQIRNNIFKQYNKAIEINDSASVQMKLAMIYFINDYHEQAIIYAENSIQRLSASPITKQSFCKMEIPILPIALQMVLIDKDEIKDIPLEFLAKYIIINSMNSLGHIHSEMQILKEFALLLSPNSTTICYLLLGFCYLRHGNWISALQAFDFVNQKEPDLKVGQIGFALTQLLIKIYKNIDTSDTNIFKEIRIVNIILSSSDLTQQLFALVKSDSQIDIKCFVGTINCQYRQ
ncbi:5270_t:CDS:2, partial [Gigaspora margarita]